MEKINDNNYYYLSFGILAIAIIILFLSFFFIAIKTKENQKIIVFTKYLLAVSLIINLIIYLKIDLTILLPLRLVFTFSNVNFYIGLRFIFLIIFFIVFFIIIKKTNCRINEGYLAFLPGV